MIPFKPRSLKTTLLDNSGMIRLATIVAQDGLNGKPGN